MNAVRGASFPSMHRNEGSRERVAGSGKAAVRLLSGYRLPATGSRVASLGWLVIGGMLAALLELGFAIAWWAPSGVPATRVLQGVAAWWIGRDAFASGAPAALLGGLLYCQMMIAVVLLYAFAARRWRSLLQRPLLCGSAYGAAMYVLVLEVAVPLFAVYPAGDRSLTWRLACLVAYMSLVGVSAALFTRRADECARIATD
jgi:hypothetical protein